MNEYKIQLESKDDFLFLKNEFINHANKDASVGSNLAESVKQQYFDRVFSILAENIQVNGVDWSEIVNKNSEMEAVNAELVHNLQEMQVDTEQLMRKVIGYRRQIPLKAKEVFETESVQMIEALMAERENVSEVDLENCSNQATISDAYLPKLSSGLAALSSLQRSIPDVVAKLGRAQAVIKDEGRKRSDSDNSELMNRHRRLSRQFDLASKLNN